MKDLYKTIKKFVFSIYPNNLYGQALQRAKKLINLMYGIMRSKKSSLSGIAEAFPGRKKFASKIKQIKRWILSPHNNYETHFLPLIETLLNCPKIG